MNFYHFHPIWLKTVDTTSLISEREEYSSTSNTFTSSTKVESTFLSNTHLGVSKNAHNVGRVIIPGHWLLVLSHWLMVVISLLWLWSLYQQHIAQKHILWSLSSISRIVHIPALTIGNMLRMWWECPKNSCLVFSLVILRIQFAAHLMPRRKPSSYNIFNQLSLTQRF